MKTYLKKSIKIVLWIVAAILGIFLLLVLALQIPYFQNLAKDKVVAYLEDKIKTKVVIERIEIGFPKKVILEGVYFEDQKKDTLLSGKKIAVDLNMFQLMNNKIEINSIDLQNVTAKINKNNKGVFNFDYIIKAFATPKKPEDNSPPMQFLVDKINLNTIKFDYIDAVSKNDISVTLNHFDTRIKTFDLEKMNFEIPKAKIIGLKLKLKQGLVETLNDIKEIAEDKAAQNNLKIKLGEIDLSKIAIDYQDETSKLTTKIALQKLFVQFNSIDLRNQFLDIQNLNLEDTKGDLVFGELKKNNEKTISSTPTNNWKIKINTADLKKVSFHFDDKNASFVKSGMDYNHLDIENFNLLAENLNYNSKKTSGTINLLSIKEKKGLEIQSLQTNFVYTDKGVSLKKLYLKTPQTLLRNEIIVGYPSVATIVENIGELDLKANLVNSKLSFKDLLLFAPTLENVAPFNSNPNAIVNINSKISGKLKNIAFPKMEISGIGATKIAVSGKIIGLPDYKKAYFDLTIQNLQSTEKDISQLLPIRTLPNTIQLPNHFNTKGTFKGTMDNFNTDLKLTSSFGNAKIKAIFDQRVKNKEKYDAQTELDNFDLGKFLKNDTIGKITVKANFKGTGLNPKTANAIIAATVFKADFKKYTYKNIVVNGKINNGLFDVKAGAKDPNLTFDLVSSGSFRDKYPTGKLKLNVDIADLEKLNLHAGPMKLRGEIDADIQSADLDYLNGKIAAYNFIIANAKEQFVLDSITLVSSATNEKNTLILKSQFMNASIDGKYKLSQIADALQNSISKYYKSNTKYKKSNLEKQHFIFKIDTKDSPILVKLIPELKILDPMSISGKYNSVNDTIILNATIPKLIYAENTISGAVLNIDTKENALLVYSLVIEDIQNANFQIPYTNITGKVENNTVDYNVQLKDLKNKERYVIAGTLKNKKENFEINLSPKNLLLNYEAWNLSEDNIVRFGKNGVYANNFELSKSDNSIKIQSQSNQENAPIKIDFKDFEIETITNIAQKSDLQISGKINGTALVKNINKATLFNSDLKIDDFAFRKDTVGTINIKVNNQTSNQYNAEISITGQDGNQVNLDGNYKPIESRFDMNLALQKLNLKSIQGFSFGNITESKGFLSGNFKITGNINNPVVLGELKFNEIGFKATQLNAEFKSMNDKIVFSNNTIGFNDFIIKDEKNNDLLINGKIQSTDFRNFGFDLKVDTDNFKAVNSKAKDNDLYYGELYLDNHLKIKGTLDNPIVEGNIKVNKDTKFTIVLPQEDPSIADREGIVEFIDQDQPKLITTFDAREALNKTAVEGITASVNIEIDKEAELSMIIDKANGDYLKLKGEAQLNGGIDPSGKTTLTGRYEFTEGTYEMNFNLIRRKFDIKKGSYILWTGEPTTADINITAVYKSNTAPIDLVDDQLGAVTAEVRNTYKQRIPFETLLKMKGDLMKPIISFDIILPDGNNNVSTEIINTTQAKLTQLRQQPDELNKQVFALLLLNRFIGENPFASESGGTSASAFARASASKILSQQLNNLAGDLINGLEINFDLQSSEDYTTGQRKNRTDLNVGVSKKLLNDRLKVTIGSSFGLEGPQQANQETSNIAGDVSLDYQLTKDGRYKVRAYRINKYQVALQGEVVETGVAFIITLDYNKFSEIFHRNEAQKAKKKNNKEVKKKSDD